MKFNLPQTILTIVLHIQILMGQGINISAPTQGTHVTIANQPLIIIWRAHSAAFSNKTNLLTQAMAENDKQQWTSMLKEVHKFIESIKIQTHIFPFFGTSNQKKSLSTLQQNMAKIERINNDLFYTLTKAFEHIAQALPEDKKIEGTRDVTELNPQAVDLVVLNQLIIPLHAQKLVAIDIQKSIKSLPKTSNKDITQAAVIIETLGSILETTIDAIFKNLDKIENFVDL